MSKKRPTASLFRDRDGEWAVKIELPDGTRIVARTGQSQRIVYSKPERVPTHLKERIVPGLISQARDRNLRGE